VTTTSPSKPISSQKSHSAGVELPEGQSGSSYFHELLQRAVQRFPEALSSARFPSSAQVFKQKYAEILPAFEAARMGHPSRVEIARFVCLEAERGLHFASADGDAAFADVLARDEAPLPLTHVSLEGAGKLTPEVRHRGRRYAGREVLSLVQMLRARELMTDAATQGFERLFARIDRDGGTLSLRGQRFAILGAGAELSPVNLLLEAGADVLWIDLREPASERLLDPRLGGKLSFPRGGADLLAQPARILATLRAYAEDGPVHMGCYAYAGGASQEWRLTTTMNALVRALPARAVASVAMLVSPTTPSRVSAENERTSHERMRDAARWKRALQAAGRLMPALEGEGDAKIVRAIVKAQGVSYQAAQLVGKLYAAEASAVYGNTLEGDGTAPLTVSANVAPITATRSLAHPVFQAAFLGASLFDVEISEPETTRALGGLLAMEDVTDPEAPGAAANRYKSASERANAVLSQQIHGGIYTNPFALDGAISVAAVRGLTMRPKLAVDLSRGLFR